MVRGIVVVTRYENKGLKNMLKYRKLYLDSFDLNSPAKEGDAGFDLCSYETKVLPVGIPTEISTGVAIELPPGSVGLVVGRSGLAFKNHITVFHVGTIDSGYRGEIKVLLLNIGTQDYTINPGDKIAQLLVLSLEQSAYRYKASEVEVFSDSVRGETGFGSTGK